MRIPPIKQNGALIPIQMKAKMNFPNKESCPATDFPFKYKSFITVSVEKNKPETRRMTSNLM